MCCGVRDRVIPECATEGVAAQQALQGEPRAAQHAEPLHSFVGVSGTGWLEAAGATEEGGEIHSVEIEDKQGRANTNPLLWRSISAAALGTRARREKDF